MRQTIFSLILCLLSVGVYAQNELDALLLSQVEFSGTSRSAGMSGAVGAMGADPSMMYTNPAGLGLYRSGEFSFTPVLQFQNTVSNLGVYDVKEKSSRFSVNNVSYISTTHLAKQGLKSLTFGVGYNRLSNFFAKNKYSAQMAATSFLDGAAADISDWGGSNPASESDLTESSSNWYNSLGAMAYRQYLINPSEDGDYYQSEYEYTGYEQDFGRQKRTTGHIGEWDFSMAANLDDVLYLGFNLGLQEVEYNEEITHYEMGGITLIDYYRFVSKYEVDGYGVNANFGMIFRPVDGFRLGISYHSPTWMKLSNYNVNALESKWLEKAFEDQTSLDFFERGAESYYDFKLKTPAKFEVGATFQLSQFGLLNLNYEYIDYSKMKYTSKDVFDQFYYDQINSVIQDTYQATNNFKAGLEVRLNPLLSARLGYAYYQNPYQNSLSLYKDNSMQNASFGIGYRTGDFYLDFTYMHTFKDDYYWMYAAPNVDAGTWDAVSYGSYDKLNNGRLMFTFGFRF